MKKLLFVSFLLFFSLNMSGQTQPDTLKIKKNIIKTDIAELLLTTIYHLNTSWEHLVAKKSSFQLDFYLYKNRNELGFSDFTMGLTSAYRFYFNKNANQMKGFYLAPFARMDWAHYQGYYYAYYYQNDNTDVNYQDYDNLTPYAGLQTGYQFLLNKNWILNINTELGISLKSKGVAISNRSYLAIGLKAGYKF